MLKILDQIPIWKTLRNLPGRVDALERQIADLQARSSAASHMMTCAECGAPAKIVAVVDHPIFAPFGVKLRTVACEAGHRHDYKWDPAKDS